MLLKLNYFYKLRQALLLVVVLIFFTEVSNAQELYTYTEPASNMAAKSIGFRANSIIPLTQNKLKGTLLNPEIMVGVSKKLMVHAELYALADNGNVRIKGTGLYGKYRFYSSDDVHKHFRMALTQRFSYFKNYPVLFPVQLTMRNSGSETGIVATQLIKKTALSAGVSYIQGWDNGSKNKWAVPISDRQAVAYSLSFGQLVLPKEYISYDQLNMNLMFEILGQTNLGSGRSFVDLAPSIQFIIKSRMRVDLGYRKSLINSYTGTGTNALLLRFEYNIFNAF